MKPKLSVSFSGGRTSAYMTKMLLDNYSDQYDFLVLFANTGQEHPLTLEFVKRCDDEWGFNTVWIEAVVNPEEGKGIRHKVVTFETASRDGKPFEDVTVKYGVANQLQPFCSKYLKQYPIDSYLKSVGAIKNQMAIGIRADEKKRVSKTSEAKRRNIVYPLVDWMPTTKDYIVDWFSRQAFDLEIQEMYGNCVWCWKKPISLHLKLIKRMPEAFDFPRRMEKENGLVRAENNDPYVFFWGKRSTDDLFAIAEHDTQMGLFDEIIAQDAGSECGESCEVYPMDTI